MHAPTFTLVLCLALLVGSSTASPMSFFTSKFRTLAEYKLGAAAKLASYFSGDRAVKASVDLKVADAPTTPAVEESAVEVPVPVEEVSVEQVEPLPPVPPSRHLELSVADGDSQEVYDFKKQFAAGYAALDFANQLERRRLAASASTSFHPQRYEAPVVPLPLEHYKEYISAGNTGGELMRVAVVAQDAKQSFYLPSHPGTQPWAQQEQGSQLASPEQQLSTEEPTKVGPAPFEGQSHLFPYGEWQVSSPVDQHSSSGLPPSFYNIPASDSEPQSSQESASADLPELSSSLPPPVHERVIIPGSRLPASSPANLESSAESAPDSTAAASASHPSESETQQAFADGQGPRYRRDVMAEEEEAMPVVVRALNTTISGVEVEEYFRFLRSHDKDDCLAKLFCTMVANPSEFGERSTDVATFFEEYRPLATQPTLIYYKDAAAVGRSTGACDMYATCSMNVQEMKAAVFPRPI